MGRKCHNDKFYTKSPIAIECIQQINLSSYNTIIEPSAGNGSFANQIENCLALDIDPEYDNIIQQDFLLFDSSKLLHPVLVIGNPPFGRQSSVAIKFIKKSCEFCDDCSFILPKSFKKNSLKRAFPPNFHLIYETDLPSNSFLVDAVEHDVPCVFQIWEKKDTKMLLKKKSGN